MTKRITPATAIAIVALFFSLGGVGFAASRYLITSIHQIKPSVRHALRGERGQQGVPGVNGATGLTGPQGPQGPAADAGTSTAPLYVTGPDTEAAGLGNGPTQGFATAVCPAGTAAQSGGWTHDTSTDVGRPDVSVLSSSPAHGSTSTTLDRWTVTVQNEATVNYTFRAFVLCR